MDGADFRRVQRLLRQHVVDALLLAHHADGARVGRPAGADDFWLGHGASLQSTGSLGSRAGKCTLWSVVGNGRGKRAMAESVASPIVKQTVWGGLLLVLALILWELRDAVPSWLAKSVTATAEFSTTGERDDARACRAFDAVRGSFAADAILEVLPNQTQVRHTRLTAMAPSSDQAVDLVTRMSDAMQKAFAREGEGEFL